MKDRTIYDGSSYVCYLKSTDNGCFVGYHVVVCCVWTVNEFLDNRNSPFALKLATKLIALQLSWIYSFIYWLQLEWDEDTRNSRVELPIESDSSSDRQA